MFLLLRHFHKTCQENYDPFPFYLFVGKLIFSGNLPLKKSVQIETATNLLINYSRMGEARNFDEMLNETEPERETHEFSIPQKFWNNGTKAICR